jgi:hypothetical protein
VILHSVSAFAPRFLTRLSRNLEQAVSVPVRDQRGSKLVRLPDTCRSVRQRDTFIPPPDVGSPAWPMLLAGSLFNSMVSALPSYGTTIALICQFRSVSAFG